MTYMGRAISPSNTQTDAIRGLKLHKVPYFNTNPNFLNAWNVRNEDRLSQEDQVG